jgi:hypothetical protein
MRKPEERTFSSEEMAVMDTPAVTNCIHCGGVFNDFQMEMAENGTRSVFMDNIPRVNEDGSFMQIHGLVHSGCSRSFIECSGDHSEIGTGEVLMTSNQQNFIWHGIDAKVRCNWCITNLRENDEIAECEFCQDEYIIGHRELLWDGIILCGGCYTNTWECEWCGYEGIGDSDHEDYCEERHHSRQDDEFNRTGVLYSSFKPRNWNFYRGATEEPTNSKPYHPYFGIELETEVDSIQDVMDIFNGTFKGNVDEMFAKMDGSLAYGIEFVSHPRTLEGWREFDKFWNFMKNATDSESVKCWKETSPGLHIGLNRASFMSKVHMARWAVFIMRNKDEIINKVARRVSYYANWENLQDRLMDTIKDSYNASHYDAMNFSNSTYVEVRFFKPGFNKDRILSCIEFLHATQEFTKNMRSVDVVEPTAWEQFEQFVASSENYQLLGNHMKLEDDVFSKMMAEAETFQVSANETL